MVRLNSGPAFATIMLGNRATPQRAVKAAIIAPDHKKPASGRFRAIANGRLTMGRTLRTTTSQTQGWSRTFRVASGMYATVTPAVRTNRTRKKPYALQVQP